MKKPNYKKADNPERGRKRGIKAMKRRKAVKVKMAKAKEQIRLAKIRKEQKFQEYLDNLVGNR